LYSATKEKKSLQIRTKSSLASCTNGDLHSYILDTKQLLESELAKLLFSVSDLRLRPLLEYALLSKGKRLRPILVMLSAQSVGGTQEKVTQLALSFELLHTATLVHDDMIDQDTSRRGKKTLYSRWSTNGAILAGDALIALSVSLVADYGPKVTKILSNVGLELCDGEYVDANLSLEVATETEYFAKIERKSASLFRGAAICGALAAEGKPLEVEALAKYGECFGMAYQLNDDLDDLLSKNQISQDLRNGNVTLPFIQLYQHGDASAKELLKRNFGNGTVTKAIAEEIKNKMEETGAFKYGREKIAEYSAKSKAGLKGVKDSVFKSYLMRFSDCVTGFEGLQV
jgi:octaprenyl-diphosphate synthase